MMTESEMLSNIRKRFLFVDVVQGKNKNELVISHKSSRTIAEYSPDDEKRMKELCVLYGTAK